MRQIGKIFGCVLLISLSSCYSPQPVAGPEVPAILANKNWVHYANLKLHVFNTGTNRVPDLLAGPNQPWRPVPAFVIEHPQRGLVIFDCGLGPEIADKQEGALHPVVGLLFKSRSATGGDLASQMRHAGWHPEKVNTVILSHLHFDHTGTAPAFTNATFVTTKGVKLKNTSRFDGLEPAHTAWIAPQQQQEIDFTKGKPYATFLRTIDLFEDGSIILVEGEGHSEGDMAAIVQLPQGPVLLTGDAVVHFDWLNSQDVQKIAHHPDKAAAIRNQVRALQKAEPTIVVIPGHDLASVPGNRTGIILHQKQLFQPEAWLNNPTLSAQLASKDLIAK
ncbi:MBL fold metallo-hydrolase [Adhaeribacter radiodurans]|uniref:MBL fold metallo-hydrolase n=1 Tax=Adhaeribacter radiodurans TaxID=2745197 RepID=A0A7L7L1P3_9BACT|nr:MBL fold metallo-hydrolase [Adhaeribacter radiodurans]QMU26703.1 MBL fold metallo-hydrolase [Adhaeribacter radiodurans]